MNSKSDAGLEYVAQKLKLAWFKTLMWIRICMHQTRIALGILITLNNNSKEGQKLVILCKCY